MHVIRNLSQFEFDGTSSTSIDYVCVGKMYGVKISTYYQCRVGPESSYNRARVHGGLIRARANTKGSQSHNDSEPEPT